jgi:tRNA(adenine34) deaminase
VTPAGETAHVDPDLEQRMMELALEEARSCLEWGDVPIGAVVARAQEVLARAGNQRERLGDPTAHAEILALRGAAEAVGSWRLEGCTVYVSLEPCAMCAGAMVLARVARVVFAAADPKAGFAGSLGDLLEDPRLNHRAEVSAGVLEAEAAEILREFFRGRRGRGSGPSLDSPRRRAGVDERDRLESG